MRIFYSKVLPKNRDLAGQPDAEKNYLKHCVLQTLNLRTRPGPGCDSAENDTYLSMKKYFQFFCFFFLGGGGKILSFVLKGFTVTSFQI